MVQWFLVGSPLFTSRHSWAAVQSRGDEHAGSEPDTSRLIKQLGSGSDEPDTEQPDSSAGDAMGLHSLSSSGTGSLLDGAAVYHNGCQSGGNNKSATDKDQWAEPSIIDYCIPRRGGSVWTPGIDVLQSDRQLFASMYCGSPERSGDVHGSEHGAAAIRHSVLRGRSADVGVRNPKNPSGQGGDVSGKSAGQPVRSGDSANKFGTAYHLSNTIRRLANDDWYGELRRLVKSGNIYIRKPGRVSGW